MKGLNPAVWCDICARSARKHKSAKSPSVSDQSEGTEDMKGRDVVDENIPALTLDMSKVGNSTMQTRFKLHAAVFGVNDVDF